MAYNTGYEISPKSIYQNKKSYIDYVDQLFDFINVIDFDKQRYYGFRNKEGLEIYPNIDRVVESNSFNIVAFDFVIEAYEELVDAFYGLTRSNIISNKSVINKALSNPAISLTGIDYDEILKNNYLQYNAKIIRSKERNQNTMSVKSYIGEYIKNIKGNPQTYLRIFNKNLTRNLSGIAINLIKVNLASDEEKIKFINDENFLILRKLCEQYGFYININIPWQLVANLSHPLMIEKASKFTGNKILNINDIVDNYYEILLFDDYEKQKEFFLDAYSDFCNKREYYSDAYFCNKNQQTVTKVIFREKPPEKEVYLKTDELFFMKIYLDILNSEMSFKYDNTEKNNILKTARGLYLKNLDKKKALVYIRSRFYDVSHEQLHPNNKQQNQKQK